MTYLRLTLIGILFLTAFSPAGAQIWDQTPIVSGDAESGAGVTTRTAAVVKNIPGWTTAGNFTLGQYVNGMNTGTRYMKAPGKQFFAGGPGGGAATGPLRTRCRRRHPRPARDRLDLSGSEAISLTT
jgi:hypothetical protein